MAREPTLKRRLDAAGSSSPSASALDLSPIVEGPGWAIRRVGPWVIGHWNAPLNRERVIECGRLYTEAAARYGHFDVFAPFTVVPFEADLILGGEARRVTYDIFTRLRPSIGYVIIPLLGGGLAGSLMRTTAASFVLASPFRIRIQFPASVEAGFDLAQALGRFEIVSEEVVRRELEQLRALADASCAQGSAAR